MAEITAGIVGYGNLGCGVEKILENHDDIELLGIFPRRPVESLSISSEDIKVLNVDEAENYQQEIDVMFLCGGSARDLPRQGPEFARMFNTVDSYDNHDKIPEYFARMDGIARENDNTCAVGIGWDPGLFSLNRMLMQAIMPQGQGYTFWGEGVSQGHSDAIRELEGVFDAVQYTIPRQQYIEDVRSGETPPQAAEKRHLRRCFVVLEEGADEEEIARSIREMPNYFAGYETEINFVSRRELEQDHAGMPHGGFVMRNARTGSENENSQIMEFSLDLDSNPEFTASVMAAYGRAAVRLNAEGRTGARTVWDIAPSYLSSLSPSELRESML